MQKLLKLIKISFKEIEVPDTLMKENQMEKFIKAETMKIYLITPDGKKVTFMTGKEPKGKVLCLQRKNKDKLNPKRLCFDLSTSFYTFGVSDPDEEVNIALAATLELKNRFSTESAIMAKNLAKEEATKSREINVQSLGQRGIYSIFEDWKHIYNESLDQEVKFKMNYNIGIWEVLEKDMKLLCTPCTKLKIKFDWALDFLNFSCSCIYSMITQDTELAPDTRELKIVAAGIVSDFIARSEEEYTRVEWWSKPAVIERAKKWSLLFDDMKKLLSENMRVRLAEDYVDPQIINHIKVLEMMISVYEILKQARNFKSGNKVLQEQYTFFLKVLKSTGGDLINVYKKLIKSDLLWELLSELKSTVRKLTNSE